MHAVLPGTVGIVKNVKKQCHSVGHINAISVAVVNPAGVAEHTMLKISGLDVRLAKP